MIINENIVPCGRCYVCRTNLLSDWIIRLQHEQHVNPFTQFITLTYKTECLTYNDTGEGCLIKSDLQKWLKRLRKLYKVRYYAVGEYGTKFQRPHYHVILFSSQSIPHSDILNTWQNGHVHTGQLTAASMAYTLKYVYNRRKYQDKPSEFALMSRKPGLGASRIPFLSKRNYLYINGHKKRLPRYYKLKLMTKEEREAQKQITLASVAEIERKEIDRLRRLGYAYPELEMNERAKAYCDLLEYQNKRNDYKRKF